MTTVSKREVGWEYTFDGKVFSEAKLGRAYIAPDSSDDGFRQHGGYTTIAPGAYREISPNRIPEGVRESLIEAWTEKARAEAEEAARRRAAEKAYAEEAAREREEARGHGSYVCVLCGHRQTHGGLCDYCGDAETAHRG